MKLSFVELCFLYRLYNLFKRHASGYCQSSGLTLNTRSKCGFYWTNYYYIVYNGADQLEFTNTRLDVDFEDHERWDGLSQIILHKHKIQ